MRILCLSYEYPPLGGGGSAVCRGLSAALVRCGHHVDIVTSGFGKLPAHECCQSVDIYRVRCFRRNRNHANAFELSTVVYPMYAKALELVSRHRYDINHTHFIIPTGIASHWLYLKTGLPYIITAHGSDIPGYNEDRFKFEHKLVAPYWRRIIKQSSGVISPSDALKDLIEKNVDIRVDVIANGYDPARTATAYGNKKKMVLVVTRMFERKGVQYLIEAARSMDTDWEFVIVGDGPYLPKLRAMAANMQPRVRFTGYISGKPLMDLYQQAAIFVFPSTMENFPVVLLEAMDSGCAVITTMDRGCSEAAGDAALKVEPRNPGQIKEALIYFMGHPDAAERLSLLAQKRISELSWASIADQTQKVMEKALC
ncbi:MAG: glycosyltransferase family 4 protein [Desulfobacteraceae bacterium]|nr:glycosyltransferase family 4 protein [Desulfobacteraceae bacterium]